MPTAHVLIGEEQLLEIVQTIWTSMICLSVSQNQGEYCIHDAAGLTACVQISGGWQGVVLFAPTEKFARRAASLMLDTDESEITTVDILDAMAELCNMIGGGVKSLLPGRCSLSLPSVMQGQQYVLRIPKTRLIAQLEFGCEAQSLAVRVLTQST